MKKIIPIILALVLSLLLVGCNQQIIDLTYTYNYAYIEMPNGSCIEGKVDSWTDFDDGDQLQVVIDGVTYLTDTTRCVLVKK